MGILDTTYVPPIGDKTTNLMLVGEAPGGQERLEKEPFVGEAGNKLTAVLGRYGRERSDVWLTNLGKYQPYPDNHFDVYLEDSNRPTLDKCLEELKQEIREIQPNLIVALGAWSMYFLTGLQGKKPGFGISTWRGGIFPCTLGNGEFSHIKVLPTYHPSYVLRNRLKYPVLDLDIRFASHECKYKEILSREKNYTIAPKNIDLVACVEELLKADFLACDIETFKKSSEISCIGFASSVSRAISFTDLHDPSVHTAVDRILSSGIPLTFHFGIFDVNVLETKGFKVANWANDTLIQQHVLNPELERSLDYLASTLTYPRQNYWKHMRREATSGDVKSWGRNIDIRKLLYYNCDDCCVTFECDVRQRTLIEGGPYKDYWKPTYDFEMNEARSICLDLSRVGILVDNRRRDLLKRLCKAKLEQMQADFEELVGASVNINSSPQMQVLLYNHLKLPKQYEKKSGSRKLTTDNDALVTLINWCKTKREDSKKPQTKAKYERLLIIVTLAMFIRSIRKMISSYLDIELSKDGRLRSIWKNAGTDTTRWSCEMYFDGTGCNAQTFPRDPLQFDEWVVEKVLGKEGMEQLREELVT